MASIIKANQLQDFGGNSILTSDGAGNLTTQKINYPAFEAYLSSDQTVSDVTYTKTQIDTEVFDTNNAYDNSTNYRFTPQVAGKYFVYGSVLGDVASATQLEECSCLIYKNGVSYRDELTNFSNNDVRLCSTSVRAVIDMNGSTDYLELFCRVNDTSGTPSLSARTKSTYFGAYRIGS